MFRWKSFTWLHDRHIGNSHYWMEAMTIWRPWPWKICRYGNYGKVNEIWIHPNVKRQNELNSTKSFGYCRILTESVLMVYTGLNSDSQSLFYSEIIIDCFVVFCIFFLSTLLHNFQAVFVVKILKLAFRTFCERSLLNPFFYMC